MINVYALASAGVLLFAFPGSVAERIHQPSVKVHKHRFVRFERTCGALVNSEDEQGVVFDVILLLNSF